MKVKELIAKLSEFDGELKVLIENGNNNGCSDPSCGCGYGKTYDEEDIEHVHDLETRIVLSWRFAEKRT